MNALDSRSKNPLAADRPGRRESPRRGRTARRWLGPLWRWVGLPAVTVVISSFVIFMALSVAPGDPLATVTGSHPTPETRALLERQYGLDRPLIMQYLHWIGGVAQGDFGHSIAYRAPVWSLLAPRLGTSLFLVAYAGLLVIGFGLAAAVAGTIWRPLSSLLTVVSGICVSIPAYVAASVLSIVFATGLGWFPTLGAGEGFTDRLWHLTLPAVALAIGWGAYLSQVARAALREQAGREHVETGVARGIPYLTVFRRHVVRNAAVPIVTVSALVVASLIVGSVVVEVAFGIDGIGSFFVRSVQTKDYASVEAISLFLVLLVVVLTTVLDLLHTVLDPRLRDSGASR
ncbi:ABC transporter permease [Streptomyces phaeolivaceus]|uniref:ABC transporter permease n=1 Tax=Streptomyces phaeolivaceus TaxID=2653200 RepID=UPI001869FC65|nr:ABC transporter permease [Streptomyces phaeolivaceus]